MGKTSPAIASDLSHGDQRRPRLVAQVTSGTLGSASKVILERLGLFESYHSVQSVTLANLKKDIEQGQADKPAGRVAPLDIEDIKAEGRRQRSLKTSG